MPALIQDFLPVSCLSSAKMVPDSDSPTGYRREAWHVEIQGRVVRFFRSGCKKPPHFGPRKQKLGPWSENSRMRLLRFINRIDYSRLGPASFVTLTYPDDKWSISYEERVDQRNAFHQKWERHYGKEFACLWRVEWEERKSGKYTGKLAPHFHLIMIGNGCVSPLQSFKWWNDIVGGGVSVDAIDSQPVYNEDGVGRYVSKYVSKYRQLDIATYVNSGLKFGRHWGVRRYGLIPMSPIIVSRELDLYEKTAIQDWATSQWNWYDRELDGGFTLLGADRAKGFAEWLNGTGQRWW